MYSVLQERPSSDVGRFKTVQHFAPKRARVYENQMFEHHNGKQASGSSAPRDVRSEWAEDIADEHKAREARECAEAREARERSEAREARERSEAREARERAEAREARARADRSRIGRDWY
jgi:hypothetical protein